MRARMATWAALIVLAASGCSSSASHVPEAFGATRDPSAFTMQDLRVLLDQEGMSEEQRAIVERAGETGFVAFDDYQQAVMANLECLREAGLNPHDVETITTGGQPLITYVIGSNPALSEDANQQLMDGCTRANSDAVEQLYSRNPGAAQRSVEAQDTHFAQAVTDCLVAAGYSVSDEEGKTWRDVAGKVLYEQTDNATVVCILNTGVAENGINLPIPEGS